MRVSGLILLALEAYFWMLLARVVFSWLRLPPRGLLTEYVGPFVYGITEPLLRPIRQALRRYQGGMPIDFSPMVVMVALELAKLLVLRTLGAAGM